MAQVKNFFHDELEAQRAFDAGELTLDMAIDAFDANRSQDNARRLLITAKEYYDDEMIGGGEFAALKAQADEAL